VTSLTPAAAAQAALRWIVQQGALFVTATGRSPYIREDLALLDFALTQREMALLNSMRLPGGCSWSCPDCQVGVVRAQCALAVRSDCASAHSNCMCTITITPIPRTILPGAGLGAEGSARGGGLAGALPGRVLAAAGCSCAEGVLDNTHVWYVVRPTPPSRPPTAAGLRRWRRDQQWGDSCV
jgi:hypothetical protein